MELVPSVLKADLADWELVNSKLEPIEQDTTPVSILLGLPKSVIKELEGWSRQLQSIVSAILPLALVLLDQSIALSPTGFHVVLTTNHTVIALTQEGEIRLITRVDPIERLGAAQIDAIIGSFGDTFPEMAQAPGAVYQFGSLRRRTRERSQGLLNPRRIDQPFGVFGSRGDHSGVRGRPDRGVCSLPGSSPRAFESLPLKSMVAYGFFTSRKERNRQRYRSDKFYRGTFTVVVMVLLAQVFLVAAASALLIAERRIDPETRALELRLTRLASEEEQHAAAVAETENSHLAQAAYREPNSCLTAHQQH